MNQFSHVDIICKQMLPDSQLRNTYSVLMNFWSKWSLILDLDRYLHHLGPEPGELVMLVWIELANIRKIPLVVRSERIRLILKAAKTDWDLCQQTSSIYQDINK